MSSKWTKVATNALEEWSPENIAEDPKEKARLRWERKKKNFKWGMKVSEMKPVKPKKNYKKDNIDDDD